MIQVVIKPVDNKSNNGFVVINKRAVRANTWPQQLNVLSPITEWRGGFVATLLWISWECVRKQLLQLWPLVLFFVCVNMTAPQSFTVWFHMLFIIILQSSQAEVQLCVEMWFWKDPLIVEQQQSYLWSHIPVSLQWHLCGHVTSCAVTKGRVLLVAACRMCGSVWNQYQTACESNGMTMSRSLSCWSK